jgi:RimJ/RimL family protein N-acetyltransferase
VITVEKPNEDRWQDYRALRLEALRSDPLAFASSFEEEQLIPELEWRRRISSVLFALQDDKPVGMVGIFRSRYIKTKHVCEIYGMYVRQAYRGQGIGKQLLEAVLKEIPNLQGITKIKIGVNPTQKAAEHLYRKYGFKTAGRYQKEMSIDGKFYDEIYLEKFL